MNLADLKRPFPPEAVQRFEAKIMPEPNSGCWLWTGAIQSGGYGSLIHKGRSWKAHRFAFVLYRGPIPNGQDVMHHCDVPSCVNPDHLSAAPTVENVRDLWRKGRGHSQRGGQNGNAKLTADSVDLIREYSHLGSECLGHFYGVHSSTIRRILRGETWR